MRAPRTALAADGVLLAITAFWATSFVLVKDALDSADPLTFLALRFGAAGLACTALSYRDGLHRPSLLAGARLSPLLFGGYALQTAGLQWTSPARSAFLTGLCVLFVPFVGWALNGRRPRPPILLGVSLAAAGMYLLTLHGKA